MKEHTLVYDSDCGFCTDVSIWVAQNGSYKLCSFSHLSDEQKELLPEDYMECAHIIAESGGVYSCESAAWHAVREIFGREVADLIKKPGVWQVWGLGYKLVASNRSKVSRIVDAFTGGR